MQTAAAKFHCTDHAVARYRMHTGDSVAGESAVIAACRCSQQVSKKSTEWYAPFVRACVKPGSLYYYNADRNLVFVANEASDGYIRILTCYPLVLAFGFKMSSALLARLGRRQKLENSRADRRWAD